MIDPGAATVGAVLLAGLLEATVGEPPARYHPVALLGQLIERLERHQFGRPKLVGTVYAVSVPLSVGAVGYLPVQFATGIHPAVAVALAGVVLWLSTSLRMLLEVARRVIEASETDTETVRDELSALVGRETASLSPALIRSAAIESLAENLSDGLVAPLVAFSMLSFVSLPAAVAGAVVVKTVNTMDSMLGYPGAFGWASARIDDLVMFIPARLSAGLLGPAAGDPDAPFRARRYAYKPASPNAGWPMATLAAALNVRLEKPGAYVLNDVAAEPTEKNGLDAIRATRRAGIAAYAIIALVGVVRWI